MADRVVRRAGGVVMLGDGVVLRRTAAGEYTFPKGHVEHGESLERTALREVAEETGLEAEITAPLGDISFSYQGELIQATFFLMMATRKLPEFENHLRSDVAVVPADRAGALLSFDNYRKLWENALQTLRVTGPGG